MWLITTLGFLSVVRNLDSTGPDDALLVRGCVQEDLERFTDFAEQRGVRPSVFATPDADYRFRLTTSREVLSSYVAERVAALNYANFKNKVGEGDPERAHVYMFVWTALQKLRRGGVGSVSCGTAHRISERPCDLESAAQAAVV